MAASSTIPGAKHEIYEQLNDDRTLDQIDDFFSFSFSSCQLLHASRLFFFQWDKLDLYKRRDLFLHLSFSFLKSTCMANIIISRQAWPRKLQRDRNSGFQNSADIQLLDLVFLGGVFFFRKAGVVLFFIFIFISYNSSRSRECVFMEVGIPQWRMSQLQLFLYDSIDRWILDFLQKYLFP